MKKWSLLCLICCAGLLLSGCAAELAKRTPEERIPPPSPGAAVTVAPSASTASEPPAAETQETAPPAPSDAGLSPSDSLSLGDFPMAFGFADETGGRLIITCYDTGDGPSFDADPNQFTLAVGPYGELVGIRYAEWQEETEQNSYRDTSYNFGNLPGFVFNAIDGTLRPNQTYVLTADGPFTDALVTLNPPVPRPDDPYEHFPPVAMNDGTKDFIRYLKGRGIQWAELLSVTEDGGQIGLILFEREGDDMLFSIVYLGNDVLFWDCPAEYDEGSTWRVDMGDEPGFFEPLFLARLDNGLVLALTWGAPEGESVIFLYQDRLRFLDIDDYGYVRYWSPL